MEKEKTTKTQKVLEYLQQNNTMTTMEAFELFGASRLPAIIYQLRKKGYNIETKMINSIDRFGNPCSYGLYIYNN